MEQWANRSTAQRAVLCVFGAWLGLGALAACGGGAARDDDSSPPRATVEVVRVEPQPLRNVVEVPGQLESEHSVWIRSEVEGVIASIEFQEGQQVEQGQILFQLRDQEQRARLSEAQAQLVLAEEVYRRTQELARRSVSSTAQLDRASAELGVARARVEVAQVQLDRTKIRSPFSGAIGARRVSIGERVREETELVQLDSIERLQLVFTLPEAAVGVVAPGGPVRIRVAPYPEEVFAGEVFFVSPTLDPDVRRITLKAWIPNPDRRLRPGLFASVEAEVAQRDDALLVPESAVVYDLDGVYVWRVGPGEKVERVPVEIGLQGNGRVEVRRGLAAGDVVVTAGTHKLQPGTVVERAEATPAHAMGGAAAERGS